MGKKNKDKKVIKIKDKEMEIFNFHLRVLTFHEGIIKQYITQIAHNNKTDKDATISYDLAKSEIYVSRKA